MAPGTRVRLIADPGRVGVLTEKSGERGGRLRLQVDFLDGYGWHPVNQLEVVSEESSDPLELFEQGKFGRVRDLRGNLTYIRLNGRLANLIYSMETTNTDFYAYQFKPVLDFLDSPSNGLLIADEVGLGKTIEAGLIWTELRSRYDTRRLMVLCPAMLREKWQMELRFRFGINAEIVDATEALKKFKAYRNGEISEFAIIASLQGMRPNKGWEDGQDNSMSPASKLANYLIENEYNEQLLDLVIVDEAHYMRNPESMTSKLGRLLRAVTEYIVLLSATPINLKSLDLYQLLNLVDEDSFNQPRVFDEILAANAPLITAREGVISGTINSNQFETLMVEAKSHVLLKNNRQIQDLLSNPPTDTDLVDRDYRADLLNRLEKMNLLGRAITRTRKREVTELRVVREPVAEYVSLSDVEREFYDRVTSLVRQYCVDNNTLEGFLLVMPQRQMSSSMPAALRYWKKKKLDYNLLYEDLGNDEAEEAGPLTSQLMAEANELGDLQVLWDNDSKYHRLVTILKDYFIKHPNEKIILFSYFIATLEYLYERLEKDDIKCQLLTGGMGINKQEFIETFKKSSTSRVLLSSEVLSEGVDLQFSRVIVNYDLPWNPMKVEQRIGRIDRIGQTAEKITIWNLFYKDTIDGRIYHRLYERLGIFEQALGGLEAVLGGEIKKLTDNLMSNQLTMEQEIERIEQTAQALANMREKERLLEDQAGNLIAHGAYILNQVKAAKELNRYISSEDLWVYSRDFFNQHYSGCEFQQLDSGEFYFEVRLSDEARIDLDNFLRAQKLYGQTQLAISGSKPIRCHFLNKVSSAFGREPELISQFHPLIRFISKRIKEVEGKYYPVVCAQIDNSEVLKIRSGIYAFHIERWSIQGVREKEQLYFSVATVSEGMERLSYEEAEILVTSTALRGKDWLGAINEVDAELSQACLKECINYALYQYEEYIRKENNENADRAEFQSVSLKRHQDRQLESLENVLQRHIEHNRPRLVPATEGRIRMLKERVNQKLTEIERHRIITHNQMDVCLGLIRVN